MIPVGISILAADDIRRSALPLFERGEVDVLEYTFDTGWGPGGPPAWLAELLGCYAAAGKLLGHGVSFSLLSGAWEPRQEAWLARFEQEVRERPYRQVSEHFGFMTAEGFRFSAPLPVPYTRAALKLGRERLKRLADTAGVPVGLENLAFAFGAEDQRRQGEFLDALLESVDGFLLLDLHNLYCQSCNFGVAAGVLLESYPLQRVRELHVAGGSWAEAQGVRVRRDTHDEPVPEEVFALVELAMERCPGVEAVIFEHMENTLPGEAQRRRYRADYRRLRKLVRERVSA